MAITTATELRTALEGWLHRSDMTARLDEFIALFEARFNRDVRVRGMEASMASTALSSGAISNPTAFLAWKELRYDATDSYTLEPRPLEWVRNQHAQASAPLYFAVMDAQTVCWPTSGSVLGTYYRSLPSLTANASNWLLTSHPDLYLMGSLEEASVYTRNEKLGMMAAARASSILESLKSADTANSLNGGPLTAKAR